MYRLLLSISVLLMLESCEKENYLRLSSSPISSNFLPDFSKARKYRSNLEDTITIRMLQFQQYFEKVEGDFSNGSVPDYDLVEAEKTLMELGADNSDLRINYELRTFYSEELPQRSRDLLNIQMSDGEEVSEIILEFTDSLRCISDRCTFVDSSMKLQYRNFQDVYLTARNGVSKSALYINAANGLIGFRTADNKIYELIP